MFQTVIVGMGRSGRALHLSALRRLTRRREHAALFADAPVVVHDPYADLQREPGLAIAASVAQLPLLARPDRAVVHLCTPPSVRLTCLRELAGLGYRRILVEKPLVGDLAELPGILRLRTEHGLLLTPVAPWLASELTARLAGLVTSRTLGTVTAVDVVQSKPRVTRTLTSAAHLTALDVEIPHSLSVVLRLLGEAEVTEATCTDLSLGERVVPAMGSARVVLRHQAGASTRILSELVSPVRERRITLTFTGGRVTGHYPSSAEDDYAHLRVQARGREPRHEIFADDSLGAFLLQSYRRYREGADPEPDLAVGVRVAQLIGRAKELATARPQQNPPPVLSAARGGRGRDR